MNEDKLAYGTIFLNVVDSLLHHVTRVEMQKMHGTIFVQHLRVDMLAIYHNYIKSFTILRWKKTFQCKFILTSFK
jgi:hypothetical protein